MKHTPGPWGQDDPVNDCMITAGVDCDGGYIYVADVSYADSDEVNAANSHLIAAAPDLAEACEAAYAYLAPIDNDWPGRHTQQGQRLLCDLRDAIAKATGIAPEAVQDAHSVSAALRKARGEG